MVISGHTQVDDVVINQRDGANGNTVTEILIDAQSMDDGQYDGGVGMVATFYFDQEKGQVAIEYYSTVQDSYRRLNIVDLDHKHVFEDVVVPSTCKDRGYREKVCACGKVTNHFSLVLKTTHTYDSDTDEECNVCGKKRTVEVATQAPLPETTEQTLPLETDPVIESTDEVETETESVGESVTETEDTAEEPLDTDAPEEETDAPEEGTDATDAESGKDTETDEAPPADGTEGDGGSGIYVTVGVSLAGALLIGAAALWLARRKK